MHMAIVKIISILFVILSPGWIALEVQSYREQQRRKRFRKKLK